MARILVVDDEESIVYTFESFLSDEGHEVLTARSYEEALERLSGTDVDVVFSDILLGGRSGIDVLREVKARGLECPVVMITGYPEVRTASEAVRLGAFDYVAKPVVQETLLRLTSVALQHKRALDESGRYRSHLEAIFRSVDDAIITVDGEMNVLGGQRGRAGALRARPGCRRPESGRHGDALPGETAPGAPGDARWPSVLEGASLRMRAGRAALRWS